MRAFFSGQWDTPRRRGILLVLIVGLAAVVRLLGIGSIPPGMWYDEAINGLDALSIGRDHWPIFFATEMHPREPLYMYSLAGFFALFGHSVAKARIVSALWGVATVALFYPVAKRLLGGAGWGLVATLALSVFRWHVHFSRTVFRTLLAPFFLLGVMWFFLRWRERRRPVDALLCGAMLGGGMYTYISFRLVPVLLGGWVLWLLARGEMNLRRDWRGLAMIATAACVVFAPLGVDYVRNPWHFHGRTDEVSMFVKQVEVTDTSGIKTTQEVRKTAGEALRDVGANARDIALMWTWRGDHVGKHNLPLAPVFDWATGLLFLVGIGWCLVNITRNQTAFVVPAWLGLMALTSVFSFGAPNILRMLAAAPAAILAMVLGMKVADGVMARGGLSIATRRGIFGLVLLVFAALQLDSYFRRFPQSAEVRREFNTEMFFDPAQLVLQSADGIKTIWVPEEMMAHPTFDFVTHGMAALKGYGASVDPSTTGTLPSALLITARSQRLGGEAGHDTVSRWRDAGARRVGFTEMAIEDAASARRSLMLWSELWVLEKPR